MEAIKRELPNTRKRFLKQTYRTYLADKVQNEKTQRELRDSVEDVYEIKDCTYVEPCKVTSSLMQAKQGELKELRQFAYD